MDHSKRTASRTTRHHRADEPFVALLEEDFGIDLADLNAAFLAGIPGKALRSWAKKHGRGAYDRRMLNAPPVGE